MSFEGQLTQFIISGLTTGSIYALIALGFCIIHNATGIVNFTQVDFVTLGGLVMYSCLFHLGLPGVIAFALAVTVVTAVGALVEKLSIEPARSKEVLILIFITIGVSILMRGGFKIIWGKNQMALPPFTGDTPIIFLKAAILPQSIWIFCITILDKIYFFKGTTLRYLPPGDCSGGSCARSTVTWLSPCCLSRCLTCASTICQM